MFNNNYTEQAIPSYLQPAKVKRIAPGIVQEQIQVIQQNSIPTPTPGGQEIQFFLPQYSNTFLDCQSAFFTFHVSAQFTLPVAAGYGAAVGNFANASNGAIIGSFYSLFQRMSIYANSVNATDDILEFGIVGLRLLQLTMSLQARRGMHWLLGFMADPYSNSSLMAYRIRGPFPYTADGDSTVLQNNTGGTAAPSLATSYGGLALGGIGGAGPFYFSQQFDIAIPVPGSIGVNNPNMYYMGLGNTRISLYTENPANFLALPAAAAFNRVFPISATTINAFPANPNAVSTTNAAGFQLVSWSITRARFVANIVRLDDVVFRDVLSRIESVSGGILATKVTSFTIGQQTINNGASGQQNIALNIRKGSMIGVIALFNNTGGSSNAAFLAGAAEYVNIFNKYGSINPGLGANTMLQVNNVNYPKLGINPTVNPSDAYAYMLEGLGVLTDNTVKPSIDFTNWLVADPNTVGFSQGTYPQGAGVVVSGATTAFWRAGCYTTAPQATASVVPGAAASNTACTISPWYLWTFEPQENINWYQSQLGSQRFTLSNDFLLYFSLQDTPRPGLISGKNTMDGSNFLIANLITTTSYLYNVYFIALYDAIIEHNFSTREVFMIS